MGHVSLTILLPLVLAAQEKDLTSLSLEELLNLEVISVRKGREKLSRTPAAVHVITSLDIRRSGATSLPEALRLAPGIHVARMDGSAWAVGMRGFNNFTSNKLLVMIDGRTIYNPIMSGVIWSHQMIMLEDIERIEVIRGPAGSVWGANAVNGVINVVTKSASATQGSLATVSGGTMDPARVSLRHGGKIGNTLTWRSWLHHEVNGIAQAIEPQPQLGNWHAGRAGFRMDWRSREQDEVEFHGELTALSVDSNIIGYPRPMVVEISRVRGGGAAGFVLGKWTHLNRRGDQSKLQIFGDLQSMDLGVLQLGVRTFDVDLQHSVALSRKHGLLVGGGFRANALETVGNLGLRFEPPNRTYLVSNAFAQYEWQIAPDTVALTLGAKLEGYTLAGTRFQPSARLMWTPTSRQGYWAAVSGAVRAPAHTDYALRYQLGAFQGISLPVTLEISGSEKIRPEGLRAVEAGTRWQLWRKALIEVALYHNSYTRLNDTYQTPFLLDPRSLARFFPVPGGGTPTAPPSIPLFLVNGRDATARGGEIEAHCDVHRRWRLAASYSAAFLSRRLRGGFDGGTTVNVSTYYPKHMAQVRSSWELGSHWSLDAEVFRTGALQREGSTFVGGFTRVDFRLERKLGERTSISLGGQNLLRRWQAEFPQEQIFPGGRIGRSITVGARWER